MRRRLSPTQHLRHAELLVYLPTAASRTTSVEDVKDGIVAQETWIAGVPQATKCSNRALNSKEGRWDGAFCVLVRDGRGGCYVASSLVSVHDPTVTRSGAAPWRRITRLPLDDQNAV